MKKIYSLDLFDGPVQVPFLIRRLEDSTDEYGGGIIEKPHRHNYYSVIWIVKAAGTHIIDFIEYSVAPGQIFFVSPSQVHQLNTEPSPSGFVILFTSDFLQQNSIRENFIGGLKLFAERNETPPLEVSSSMEKHLRIFAGEMLEAYNSDDDMRFEKTGAWLKLFLLECNNSCTLPVETNPQRLEVGRNLVGKFKELVETHFHEWHQVKDYAAGLNVSPGYLNEVLVSSIHSSAKDYITARLLLEAKRRSLFTSSSGKEIGYSLGFEDPSHFSKFFRSGTGMSLNEFRTANPA